MKRLLAALLVLLLSAFAGYRIFTLWRGTQFSLKNPSKEDLLQAIRYTPSNSNLFYALGLYYQWNIEKIDFRESVRYLVGAVERNPLDQRVWLDLAKVLNRLGERGASLQALEKAVSVFPTGYTGRWMAANLLVQQGELQKALSHFSYILAHYPDESSLVYDVLFKVTRDPDFILDKVVPGDASSLGRYLSYVYETGDKDAATKAWARKASLGLPSDRSAVLRHVDFLIGGKAFAEASRVWRARLKEEGIPAPEDDLITNGGFEKDNVLGGGFDWKIIPVRGASVSFDASAAFEGKRSLKVVFDGKENVDFQHIYQYVSWKPGRDYLLRVRMKTREVTTKSGIRVEVIGIGETGQALNRAGTGQALLASSESLTGDNGWKELRIAFHTPAQSEGGIVRVRRDKTDKFDRLLSGVVWLDDFQLKEK